MHYREFKPSAAASRFVRRYWMLADAAPAADIQRIVPDGHTELILNLGQPYQALKGGVWIQQPRFFFIGQITGPLLLRPPGPTQIIGIRFHPHTAGRLLKVPMCELTGSAVSLRDISENLFGRFDELEAARSSREQVAALDRIVLALGRCAGEDDPVVAAAVGGLSGSMSVGEVAHHAGLSARQLERRFRQAVGISPKLFGRMQRFQRVFPTIENGDAGWADAAAQCGYYDQAHLIRDFREFAGKPPAALLADDTDLARHFLQGARMSHFSNTLAGNSR